MVTPNTTSLDADDNFKEDNMPTTRLVQAESKQWSPRSKLLKTQDTRSQVQQSLTRQPWSEEERDLCFL